MKTISAVAALSVVSILACDPVVQPEAPSPDFAGRGGGGVVEKVTGAGNFTDPAGNFRTFAFTAQRRADGSVHGQWERVNHRENASETKSHGRITCFTIVDNRVWLGGFATSGRLSTPPNNEVSWDVIDNGQGANSPADQISLQGVGRVPGHADFRCALQFLRTMFDIEAGNIKIH